MLKLSPSVFAQILCWVGLILINPSKGNTLEGPPYYLTEDYLSEPGEGVNDAIQLGDETWLAGSGILVYEENEGVKTVLTGSRYMALAYDNQRGHIWYAGSEGIGFLESEEGPDHLVRKGGGFIWELCYVRDKIWYFGSSGFGWIDPVSAEVGNHWEVEFDPKPFLISDWDRSDQIWISSNAGIWEITESGRELILPIENVEGPLIPWAFPVENGYQLGTNRHVYFWSGESSDLPKVVETPEYHDYFNRGISNAVRIGSKVAVTNYPDGVVIWDQASHSVSGYFGSAIEHRLGDIYKIAKGKQDELIVLGMEGVAKIRLNSRTRYYPGDELWNEEEPQIAFAAGEDFVTFTKNHWIHVTEEGYTRQGLLRPMAWAEITPDERIFYGALYYLDEWMGNGWKVHKVGKTLQSVYWGENYGYAAGPEGFYRMDENYELTLLLSSEDGYELLGETESGVYALSLSNEVVRLYEEDGVWDLQVLEELPTGNYISSACSDGWILLSHESGVYEIEGESVSKKSLGYGWVVRDMKHYGGKIFGLLENPESGRVGINRWGKADEWMLNVAYLDKIGKPAGIAVSGQEMSFVGEGGMLLMEADRAESESTPRGEVRLEFEGEEIAGQVLPNGAQEIMLSGEDRQGEIPLNYEYRLNQGSWRPLRELNRAIPLGGYGKITIDIRPMFPNGVQGEVQSTQFRIAPPWYLNPWLQAGTLMAIMVTGGLIYYIRHQNLKRMNLWLKSEVKRQTKELKEANSARTNFLAGLSHDIRNPLNGVLQLSESLSRYPAHSPGDPRLQELRDLGVVVDQMLGEILDFTSLDQAKIQLSYGAVNITDIINSTLKQNQWSIQRAFINVNDRVGEDLRETAIRVDRSWLIQVLSNLIVNALYYSKTERIEVGVEALQKQDDHVVLDFYVKDWGIGIDDSEKELIFEKFYRGESGVVSGHHGTGLGLSICRDIVQAMGARLYVSDNIPSGCTFHITGRFKLMDSAVELNEERILSELEGKQVLIVDDLDYNRRAMVDYFKSLGCEVESSDNGRVALEQLSKKRYYLALLDWDLPGVMGSEVARRHRLQHPNDPVILLALTAYTDSEKKSESKRVGMNGYIAKPLTSQRLTYALANISGTWETRPVNPGENLDTTKVETAINEHIEACLRHGENLEFDELRRWAHRLTTLALIRGNAELQVICRNLQESAIHKNEHDVQVGLLGLRKWKKV